MTTLLFILVYAVRLFFTIFVNSRDEDAMLEEISSHRNFVAINRWTREDDFENIFYLDISLKNYVRMYISYCKRDKNKDIVYERLDIVNGWRLKKVIYYEDTDDYGFFISADDIREKLMGNSLEYLLDNYEKVYDLYMNAPEIDRASYNTAKEIFDSIPDEGMFDVYDEKTGKVIGVGKLFKVKDKSYEYYQP